MPGQRIDHLDSTEIPADGENRAAGADPHVNPATILGPGDRWIVDGLDWSWAFVVYRRFTDYSDYCIGTNGMAWTRKPHGRSLIRDRGWRPLKLRTNGYGYITFDLYSDRRRKESRKFQAQRLVLLAFLGDCPAGLEACHWDGNPLNNNFYNLRWDTHENNIGDMFRHGRNQVGEERPNALLTASQAAEIRRLKTENPSLSKRDIASLYGVSRSCIWNVLTGKEWRTSEAGYAGKLTGKSRRVLATEDVPKIFGLRAGGMRLGEIAEKFGASTTAIRCVLDRSTFKEIQVDQILVDSVREPGRWKSGENNPRAKLTGAKVLEIRRLHQSGLTTVAIAGMFGVGKTTVGQIIRGQIWTHV